MQKSLFLSVLLLSTSTQALSQKKVTLELAVTGSNKALNQYFSQVFEEIGSRSQFNINLVPLPPGRTLVSANNGSVDGIADRAKGIEAKYPNLVRLNTPIISVQHVIFVNKKDQFNGVTNFEKLSTHINANNYIIGYMASSKKSIQEVVDIEQKNRYPLISIQQGFDMLKKGRLTAYLAGPGISNRQLFNEKYSNSNIVELGVFSKFPLYTYIHKKHSQHLQSLNQIFHELEQDGSLIVIRNSIE